MTYLHALALSVLAHPFLSITALWAFVPLVADLLPENRRD